MVHSVSSSLSDVGGGVGGLFTGITPVTTLPIYFGTAKMTAGVMKGVGKKVGGKYKSKKSKVKMKKKRGKR